MAHLKASHPILLIVTSLAALLVLAACSQTAKPPVNVPAAPTATALPSPTKAPSATQAAVPALADTPTVAAEVTATAEATATTAATATAAATATSAATATPSPLGFAQDGFSAWCLLPDALPASDQDPLNPPADVLKAEYTSGALEVRNLPSNGCYFLYTLNQPAPTGLKLAVYDYHQPKPFLTADLQPVSGKPETVWALLRHSYIIMPPVWNVSFDFAVLDSSGKELRRDAVNLHRWQPELCWDNQLPDLKKDMWCPLQQDPHPWDPFYMTPMPTPKTNE